MISLLKHNLVAGWRNVMKYKVQNTVSVLCLAVGAILFAVALYVANTIWENNIKYYISNDPVRFELSKRYDGTNNSYYIPDNDLIPSEANSLCNLPSVKSVCFSCCPASVSWILPNNKHECYFGGLVSPDWLKENNFRSATTGKKIGILKPGTIVMTKQLAEALNISEVSGKYVNYNLGPKFSGKGKISDIVYSTTCEHGKWDYYMITSLTADKLASIGADDNLFYYQINPYSVQLKDGYTQEQFKEELSKAFPDKKIQLASEVEWEELTGFILLLLLGSTILIISMSGYLKMHLQLFCLRSREMALRRCNGAKPKQLFVLLSTETFIVFAFAAIATFIMSVSFARYSMPLFEKFYNNTKAYYIDIPTIYRTEMWIMLFAFLAAIGIAWLVVHKMLYHPLSTAISRTFSQHTIWNKSMQITQYFATTVILMVIMTAFYTMRENCENYNVPESISFYKKIGFVKNLEYRKKAIKVPSVDKYAWLYQTYYFKAMDSDYENLELSYKDATFFSHDIFAYSVHVTNAEIYKMFKMNFKKNRDDDWKELHGAHIPVYTKIENVPKLIKELNIQYKPSNKIHILSDSAKYILLGWVSSFPDLDAYAYSSASFNIIEDNDYEKCSSNNPEEVNMVLGFVQPKNGDIDSYLKEAAQYNASTVYKEWFTPFQQFYFNCVLMSILAFTSLICIILTIYSSVSLETRGKQKEVVIRKVNGARTRDIILLFSRYYIVTMGISFALAGLVILMVGIIINGETPQNICGPFLVPYIGSALIITLTTILTLWQKIYKISHINPALLIKKE